MENLTQTKKPRLVADFSLDHTGGWGGAGISNRAHDNKRRILRL